MTDRVLPPQATSSECLALILHPLQMAFVEPRIVSVKVLQPTIQVLENLVQPLDWVLPGAVVSHPNSAEVLLDRDPHFVETARYAGLGETPHNISIFGIVGRVWHPARYHDVG